MNDSPDALLLTKLHAPAPRAGQVSRPHLLERLGRGAKGKLTVLSAPPGFGKSTLLAEWVHHHRAAERRVAWLSLDGDDSDLRRFLAYLLAAVDKSLPPLNPPKGTNVVPEMDADLTSMLRTPELAAPELVLTRLVNALHKRSEDVVLVLDDYHSIEAEEVHRMVEFLLVHLPANLHLVISTRVDPPLPLARLRVRGDLVELAEPDLRFSDGEAAEFLRGMDLALSEAESDVLRRRTEGWAAGLQMAALSLRGRDDRPSLIEDFDGDHRFVLDYLSEEVLERQEPATRRFLLQTAFLSRLSGALCDAVTGRDDCQAFLEELDAANLFLIPLDETRRWYRYHPLFASLLRRQVLAEEGLEMVEALHGRASDWYAAEHPEEALQHAFQASSAERAGRILERHARAWMMRGRPGTVMRWFQLVPPEWIETRPQLVIEHALVLFLNGRWQEFEDRLRHVEGLLRKRSDPRLNAQMNGLRAMFYNARGDFQATKDVAGQALDELDVEDLYLRGQAVHVLGHALVGLGEEDAAQRAFERSVEWNLSCDNVLAALIARCYLGWLDIVRGRLRTSLEHYREALRMMEEGGAMASSSHGLPYAGLAEIHRERGELDDALELAQRAIDLSREGLLGGHLFGLLVFSRVQLSRGDLDEASSLTNETERLLRRLGGSTNWAPLVESQRARIALLRHLAGSDGSSYLESIRAWAGKTGLDAFSGDVTDYLLPDHPRDYALLTAARWLIAEGKNERAAEILEALERHAREQSWNRSLVEILALRARLAEARDRDGLLAEALALAEPEGMIAVFADDGEAMTGVIAGALAKHAKLDADYAAKLRQSLGIAVPDASRPSGLDGLAEPLTRRELEVLRTIAEGHTNAEAGRRLYISPSTVKKHLENIYGKLGVRNRTEAIAFVRRHGGFEA